MIKQTLLSLSLLLTVQQATANDFIVGAIVGGLIVNSNSNRQYVEQRPPVVIIQQPETFHHRSTQQFKPYISPNSVQRNQYEPPMYDRTMDMYIYTVPDYFDSRLQRWIIKDKKIYVPSSKHFVGCNFYDYKEAEICVRVNEQILQRSGVIIQ